MAYSIPRTQNLIWVISISLLLSSLLPPSHGDGRVTEAGLYCGGPNAPTSSNFTTGFVREMENLAGLINDNGWGNSSVPSIPPLYGLAQCYGDLSRTDCLLCYAAIRTKLPRCLPSTSARIYLDGCFLRYENRTFYNQSVDPAPVDPKLVFNNCSSTAQLNPSQNSRPEFASAVASAVRNASTSAANGGGFAVAEKTGGMDTAYVLAQCWKTVSPDGCRTCLAAAWNEAKGCLPNKEGRGLIAGCYLRYSTVKFYYQNGTSTSSANLSSGVVAAIVLASAALLVLALSAAYAISVRIARKRRERRNLGQVSSALRKSSFNFKYETLEKATNYFDSSRKLGQGGAGSVYMGNLPNGKVVAVKRLVYNTRQWVDDFFNEVNLIGGIQHKNLVKLLGCSIEGPESLLVYEYVPKNSIDQYMSDKSMLQTLNWKRRLNIIVGTAEGLEFLHGGSGSSVRIIHRDIKGSNVLLDEHLNPKIADFGLARCFGPDKTHLTTGVAGTLGYMAPEYLVRGQLTEKADVYSFGVLVLEIICGRKHNVLIEGSSSLLRGVWKAYKAGNLLDVVDPFLGGDFPVNEVTNVLQIALLCTQASAASRPSMADIVQMLNNEGCEIPMPSQPPFLNANVLYPEASIRSSSTNSSASYVHAKIEGCSTSSQSSCLRSSNGPPSN